MNRCSLFRLMIGKIMKICVAFMLTWTMLLWAHTARADGWQLVKGNALFDHYRDIMIKRNERNSNSYSIVITGFGGQFSVSNDSGKTFSHQKIAHGTRFYTLWFDNPLQGWVAGWGGAIWQTVDGGNHWHECRTDFRERITSIIRLDGKGLMAVGDNGLVALSTDNGKSFRTIRRHGKKALRDISLAGTGTLCAVGYGGQFLLSSDQGKTWKQLTLPMKNPDLYSCAFSQNAFWSVGSFGTLLKYDLQSLKCKQVPLGTFAYLRSIRFHTPSIGVICGYGTVFITKDAGLTWHQITINTPFQLLGSALSPDKRTLWIVGEFSTLYSYDMSTSKVSDMHFDPGVTFYSITEQSDTRKIWIGGQKGVLMHSDNGSSHWQVQFLSPPVTVRAIRFLSADEGIAVGDRGMVYHTTDGGQTWKNQKLDAKTTLKDIALTQDHIIICGAHGLWMKSRDAVQWKRKKYRFTRNFNGICFVSNEIGWLVGDDGLLAGTTDGGLFFLGNYSGIEQSLRGCVAQGSHVLAFGAQGAMLETFNGGQGSSWNLTYTQGDQTLVKAMYDGNHRLLIIGEQGLLMRERKDSLTSNDRWSKSTIPLPENVSINAAMLDSIGNLWITGSHGLLMKYPHFAHLE